MRELKTRRKAADLAPAALADEVQAFLGGQPISLLIRADSDGSALVTVAPAGTNEAPEFDETALLALVDAHRPPPPERDEVDELDDILGALTSATTVVQLKAALVSWLTVTRGRKARGRPSKEARRG